MSGTSMDGVDVSFAEYSQSGDNKWSYNLHAAKTYAYPENLAKALQDVTKFSAQEINIFNKHLGIFYGHLINQFIDDVAVDKSEIDAIASHGHTVFHQPENGFTLQIGCGTTIAAITQLNVINDFRSKDIVFGGQGAPLVPIGDTLLFADQANAFLNIGGFANVCINSHPVVAYDVAPANLPLNDYCQKHFNAPYDKGGEFARSGRLHERMYDVLNDLDYYRKEAPKSLGTEWINDEFRPLILSYANESPRDVLHTITKHIAHQIARSLNENTAKTVMISGGGAKNDFLIDLIREEFNGEVIIPSQELIDFKEAIVFGLMGALYLAGEPNTISSVTGASKAVCAGVLHTP